MIDWMSFLPFVQFFQRECRLFQPHLFRLAQVPACRVDIAFAHGKRTPCIDRLGGVACLVEIPACRTEIIPADGGIGGIEVGNLIVREHTHGRIKDLGKLVRTGFIFPGNKVKLVQAQLLRLLCHDAADFVCLAERADVVVDTVIRMA